MRRLLALLTAPIVFTAACSGSDASSDAAVESQGSDVSAQESTATDSADAAAGATTETTVDETAATTSADEPASTDAPADTAPANTEPVSTPDLELIGFGDYSVGVTTITITDEARDRPLTVDVWFPLAEETTGDPQRYTFATGDYYQSPDAIAAEAASISPDGPFPLVVYSHGSGGQRYAASNYVETLASHGYVVAAPDHTGNTAIERITDTADPNPVIALNRPQDVRAVITAMVDPEDAETAGFVASVDPERVAATGHSFGGFTAYATAAGYANDLGDVDLEPLLDAIIPIAPAVGGDDPTEQLLSDGRLDAVTVPALVIAATNDQTTPIEPNVRRAWELTSSEPHYRLELIDAQHQTFTDVCDYVEFLPTLPEPNPLVIDAVTSLATEGCSPGDMAIPRAQALTNTFAIAFLDSVFDDGDMIDPRDVTIPDDVNYLVK